MIEKLSQASHFQNAIESNQSGHIEGRHCRDERAGVHEFCWKGYGIVLDATVGWGESRLQARVDA